MSEERELFQTYYKDVYRACYYMLQNNQDAEDVTQDVFVKVLQSNWKAVTNRKSWLVSIAMNMSRNVLKRKKKFVVIENMSHWFSHVKDEKQNLQDDLEQKETRSEFAELVGKLPHKQREVIILRYVYEYKFSEIAQILEIPEGTVKSRHHKGIKLLGKIVKVHAFIQSFGRELCEENH